MINERSESVMLTSKPVIFDATGGERALFPRMVEGGAFEVGELTTETFGDGEIYHRLDTPVTGRDVVVIGDLRDPAHVLATFDVASVVFGEGASELKIVVPEKSLPSRKFIREGLLEMFTYIPQTPCGNKLVLVNESSIGTPLYISLEPEPQKRAQQPALDLFPQQSKPVLISTSRYKYLAQEMLKYGDFELGQIGTTEVDGKPFFSGELLTNVAGRVVILVTGTVDDHETMEAFHLSRAIQLAGAIERRTIFAYWGYGTMERAVKPGEAVKAKIRARLFSCIPACPRGNRVYLVDLHVDAITSYFEGGVQPRHIYAAIHLSAAVAREMCGLGRYPLGTVDVVLPESAKRRPVLCATDAGRHKIVESMGKRLRLETAFGRKERTKNDTTRYLGALGDVHRRDILIYDDKCGTGGTVFEAGAGIRIDQYGTRAIAKATNGGLQKCALPSVHIVFAATHAVLAGNAREKLATARDMIGRPLFDRMVATDSHPNAVAQVDGVFLSLYSIAYLLCKEVAPDWLSVASVA